MFFYLLYDIDRLDTRAVECVPEEETVVGGAPTGGEEVRLPGAPGDGLDGGTVVREHVVGTDAGAFDHLAGGEDTDEIVVAPRGQVSTVW